MYYSNFKSQEGVVSVVEHSIKKSCSFQLTFLLLTSQDVFRSLFITSFCLHRHSFKFHQRRQIEFHLPVATAMSSFIEAILKATVGLLVNKGRNVAAEKLKEGDVSNEQLRYLIVRELDDIKSKLDGIARKDLLTSIGLSTSTK